MQVVSPSPDPTLGGDGLSVSCFGTPEDFERDYSRITRDSIDGGTFIAGYVVGDVKRGSFDGRSALLIMLQDESGRRTAGQLRLRHDATREALLAWTHLFSDEAAMLEWERQSSAPSGWRRIKARQLQEGHVVKGYEADGPVTSVRLGTTAEFGGADGPFAHVESGVLVHVEPWADPFDADEEVLVKA